MVDEKAQAEENGRIFFSPLYCRLNGFMSGIALYYAAFGENRRYHDRCARINSFYREIESTHQLPEAQSELAEFFRDTVSASFKEMKLREEALGDFHLLAIFLLTLPQDEADISPSIDAEISRIQMQYSLSENAFITFKRDRLKRFQDKGIASFLNPALTLLRELISVLEPEPDTCFVSMSFQAKYDPRWGTFYWPLVVTTEMRPVRAWGDIDGESYQALMFTTIDKCGALFADVSGGGPNVVNEVGYAMGAKKLTMVMQDHEETATISNIHPDWIYQYSTDQSIDWSLEAIEQAVYWYHAVEGAHTTGVSLMDSSAAPGKLLDFLDEASNNEGTTFFGWKGRFRR